MSATNLPLSLNKICLWETLRLLSSTPTPASSVSVNTCNMCVSDLAFFIFNHHSSIVGILLLDIHHTPARTRRQIQDSIMLALTMTCMTECVWECADARASTQAGLRACMAYMHGTIGQDTPAGRGRILRVDTAKSTSNFGFCERAARQHLRPLPAIHLRQSRRHTRVQLRACKRPRTCQSPRLGPGTLQARQMSASMMAEQATVGATQQRNHRP